MKLKSVLVIVFFAMYSTFMAAQESLPSVKIKTLDGKQIDISDFAKDGQLTYITLWATWCHPCKQELDDYADLYPEWKEKYDLNIVAITIDNARSLPKAKSLVESKGWEYTILSDVNSDLKNVLGYQTIPFAILVDKTGKIVYKHNGYEPGDEVEFEELLEQYSK